jgi:hypothetical protein
MIIPNYDDGTVDVHIDPIDLGKCKQLASVFSKLGQWGGLDTYGGGSGNTVDDTKRVERTGALGERAFSKMTGIPMNEEYKANGDAGFDFQVPSFSIDVKCHTRNPNQAEEWGYHGEFFTKAHFRNGSYIPPRADILIFSAIVAGDATTNKYGDDWGEFGVNSKIADNLIIRFFGAISSKKVFNNYQERLGAKLQRGGPNSHSEFKNYYIKKEELLPMIDFLFKYKTELLTAKSGVII